MSINAEVRKAAEGRQTREIELRAASNDFAISARAVKYGAVSGLIGGRFYERIAPGAFSESLNRGDEVVCLLGHEGNAILGRTRNNTLTLSDSPTALQFYCKLNQNVQAHRDVYELLKAGTFSECSFSFTADDQSWDENYNGTGFPLRTVTKARLYDVSVVSQPAYANGATSAEARARGGQQVIGPEGSLAWKISVYRREAQLFVRDLVRAFQEARALRYGDPNAVNPNIDFASHLQRCHEYAEFMHSQMQQARSVYDADDPDGPDWDADDDLDRSFRMACSHAELCCDQLAASRVHHGRAVGQKAKVGA